MLTQNSARIPSSLVSTVRRNGAAPAGGLRLRRVELIQLAIPMRFKVEHARAQRARSEPLLVCVESETGMAGWGETLPRPYVTNEDADSVWAALESTFLPLLQAFSAFSAEDALTFLDALPFDDGAGREALAARAAVELALLDLVFRHFNMAMSDLAAWAGLPSLPGSAAQRHFRFGGVLASEDPRRMLQRLRLHRWFGIRDYKLKVGDAREEEKVRRFAEAMRRPLARGSITLRLDANGGWTLEQAKDRLGRWSRLLPLAGVEQPLPKGAEDELPELKRTIAVPIIHDESLTTLADARRLAALGVADGFSIRISKCGGLLPALRLAAFARDHGALIQLGCMVGETGILSAAGLRFAEAVPDVQFAEGCYGTFLLMRDIAKPSPRFGYGGRPPRLRGFGWGVRIDPAALAAFRVRDQSWDWP